MLGPLVLGGFLADEESLGRLRSIGVRDSKLLAPERRTSIARELERWGECWTVPLSPERIDAAVARHDLNGLEAEGFARLIRAARPDRVAVDACDVRPDRFARLLAARSGFEGPIDSRHRADRDLPVVGAASIVAKVARDAAIARYARTVETPVGSGYPSDPITVEFLRSAIDGPTPAPIRRSWATTQRVIRARATISLEAFGR